jgi:hypothetical protein
MMSDEPKGKDVADALGRHLKRAYDQLLREPVPDKLLDLLKSLEKQSTPETHSAEPASGRDEEQS